MAILIANKIDLKVSKITRDKEEYYIKTRKIKPLGRHNDPKCYTPNNKAFIYMKQKLIDLKEKIDKFIII